MDAALLTAFSSDTARQQAVLQLVQGLAYDDPARAGALVDAYVTDSTTRAQAERFLDAVGNAGQPRGPGGSSGAFGARPVVARRQN